MNPLPHRCGKGAFCLSGLVTSMDARTPSRSLNDLRAELARLDRELVELLGARLRVARHAIRLRVSAGEAVTNRAQERLVLSRAHRWSIELGISPELVDRVFRDLIQCGKVGEGPGRPSAPRIRTARARSVLRVPSLPSASASASIGPA